MQDQHLEQLTLGHCPLRKDFCVWRQIQASFRFMSIHQMLGMGTRARHAAPKASHAFIFLTGLDRIVALTLGSQLCAWSWTTT